MPHKFHLYLILIRFSLKLVTGRHLIKQGELMKISRKGTNPRYFILLSDCLLYTAYSGNLSTDLTTLRLSYKIPLTQLKVDVSNRADDFQNEFSITSTVRSCTLQAGTPKERNDWLDALQTAIEEHLTRKMTFKESTINKTLEPFEKTKPGKQKCCIQFSCRIQWGSEYQTSLVFKWSKVVLSPNGLVVVEVWVYNI